MSPLLHTNDLNSTIYHDAKEIRLNVFVKEQNVPKSIEIADEELAIHCVLYNENKKPLGTVRLLPIDKTTMKVQRMAVAKEARGKGVGKQLMTYVEDVAKQYHVSTLILGAQLHAFDFYQSLGYKPFGDTYLEANIEHQNMKKII
ncbi:GNAT family N-acetyltransferase [Vagococcus luciliae]|uniref:Acetyltransferase n=1 Tax=Vagococcus luciliae TaxID=2920380 RepID=A0ABY5P205_9ENTE|nr:GNAT family N-acetyltransferase [Vagococcus luciliae]UUV99882.1 Acetyltransferase [Vagococcus luciliae]